MKLEVGMYVRTDNGIFEKVNKIYDRHTTDNIVVWLNGYGDGKSVFIDDFEEIKFQSINSRGFIKKEPSFNIIDLIEEKDLVEIEYYSPRYEERITRLFEVDFKHKDNITFGNVHCQLNIFNGEWSEHDQLLEPIIKSIVTKEQFESMSYKVGE